MSRGPVKGTGGVAMPVGKCFDVWRVALRHSVVEPPGNFGKLATRRQGRYLGRLRVMRNLMKFNIDMNDIGGT